MLLSNVCVPLIAVSDWFGGQMVHVYGVGVESTKGAHHRTDGATTLADAVWPTDGERERLRAAVRHRRITGPDHRARRPRHSGVITLASVRTCLVD